VPLAGKNVIDIGCGGGILSESMARKGAKVTGIDLSKKALKVADLHSLESGVEVRYKLIAAEDMAAEEAGQYDVVTCMEMLEHVPDPAAIVRAAATLVKPGGHVFFSTLNRNPKSYLFAVIGAEYVLRMLPRGTHDYAKFITPAELSRLHPRRRPAGRRPEGPELQSADQDLFAEPGHRCELHGGLHQAALNFDIELSLHDPDCPHRAPSCSTSTARWPTPRPTSPPPSTGCAPSAAWNRRPTPCCARPPRPARAA
jgi:SAM-dependent methyltransferase